MRKREADGGRRGRMRTCFIVMEKNRGSEKELRYERSVAVMIVIFPSWFGHAPPAHF